MKTLKYNFSTISCKRQHIEYCNIAQFCITGMGKFDPIFVYIFLKNLEIDIFYFLKN